MSGKEISRLIPYAILLVFGISYGFNFREHYDLYLFDEAFYSIGNFREANAWSPLYQFVYWCVSQITGSRALSTDVILYVTSLLVLPVSIYRFCRKLGITELPGVYIAFLVLLLVPSTQGITNLPVFNLILVLEMGILRIGMTRFRQYLIFYFILPLLLYSRVENLIFIAVFLSFDIVQFLKVEGRRIATRNTMMILGVLLVSYALLLLLLSTPLNGYRSVSAFQDHYLWSHLRDFSDQIHGSFRESVSRHFGNRDSLLAVLLSNPLDAMEHFLKNVARLPMAMVKTYHLDFRPSLVETNIILNVLLLLALPLLSIGSVSITTRKQKTFLKLFTLACAIKGLAVSILLQPWGKYLIEFAVVLLVWVPIIFSTKKFRTLVGKNIGIARYGVYGVMLLILVGNVIHTPVQTGLIDSNRKVITYLENESDIKNVLSDPGLKIYSGKYFDINEYEGGLLFSGRENLNLKQYLKENDYDTVILVPLSRRLIRINKLDIAFGHFEQFPFHYGFKRVHGGKFEGITIYRLLNSATQ